MASNPEGKVFSVGGNNTHVILELSNTNSGEALFYLGSALTVSYSTYRNKTPVFNLGSHIIDGVAIGNKYVAGSIVSVMFTQDEFAKLAATIKGDPAYSRFETMRSIKEVHNFTKDDIVPVNMHCLFASEYTDEYRKIVIYDVTFINDGLVMSINDLITERTVSFIARDVTEQGDIGEGTFTTVEKEPILTASQLLGL